MFISVAGNLGGDLGSVIDPLLLRLAMESKSGIGYNLAVVGFAVMFISKKSRRQYSREPL